MRFSDISAEAQRKRAFLLGLAPALIVLIVITLAPALYLVATSLTPLDLTRPEVTAGDYSRPWTNYVELWTDKRFHNSVWVQVQLSVVDTETLRQAQLHPQEHRDLMVRITGYSAVFVDMAPHAQEEIIRREELGCP